VKYVVFAGAALRVEKPEGGNILEIKQTIARTEELGAEKDKKQIKRRVMLKFISSYREERAEGANDQTQELDEFPKNARVGGVGGSGGAVRAIPKKEKAKKQKKRYLPGERPK